MKNILKYIGYCLCFMLSVIIIISIIETFFFKNEYPFIYKTALILSGSMEPTLSVDDLVIVKRVDKINEGDIIAFYNESGNKVMHRVIEIEGDTVITQGDANNVADTPISKDKVCGIYVGKIKYAGKIVKFIKTPLGISICFALTLLILIFPEKYEEKHESIHAKEDKMLNKTKIISATITYTILLAICIVAGYYSKYKTSLAGNDTGVVAKFSVGINKTEEINLFEASNINEDVTKGKIIPGTTGNVDIVIYNQSEVYVRYEISISELENKYNIPIKYSLDGVNYYAPEEFSKKENNVGNMEYLKGEKQVKIYWKWDFEQNTNIDTNLVLKSEDVTIITQISVEFTQID